jgi:hypothetical protein
VLCLRQPSSSASPCHHNCVLWIGVVRALPQVIRPHETRGRPVLRDAARWGLRTPVAERRINIIAGATVARMELTPVTLARPGVARSPWRVHRPLHARPVGGSDHDLVLRRASPGTVWEPCMHQPVEHVNVSARQRLLRKLGGTSTGYGRADDLCSAHKLCLSYPTPRCTRHLPLLGSRP